MAAKVPRKSLADHDVCVCGDWRYQHRDGKGRCHFGTHYIPDKSYDICTVFRLAHTGEQAVERGELEWPAAAGAAATEERGA